MKFNTESDKLLVYLINTFRNRPKNNEQTITLIQSIRNPELRKQVWTRSSVSSLVFSCTVFVLLMFTQLFLLKNWLARLLFAICVLLLYYLAKKRYKK